MEVGAISNNSLDIQALLSGPTTTAKISNGYDVNNKTAEYARKGEPMYMADMDKDGDGIVTLDEFKDYCKDKGINSRDMVKMSQMASAYRTMQAENSAIDYISKLIPNVLPNIKEANQNSANVKNDGNKFNISTDETQDKMVSYAEYMAYCEQNAASHDVKAVAKAEETEDGNLKIKNYGKAVNAYKKSEGYKPQSTFEEVV